VAGTLLALVPLGALALLAAGVWVAYFLQGSDDEDIGADAAAAAALGFLLLAAFVGIFIAVALRRPRLGGWLLISFGILGALMGLVGSIDASSEVAVAVFVLVGGIAPILAGTCFLRQGRAHA